MFAVLVSIQNPQGLLMPGMNAEVDISIARSVDVLTVPIMALRTKRDIPSTALILGMDEAELRSKLKSGAEPAAAAETATVTIGDRTVVLPPGVDAETVRGIAEKRRSGAELSADERQLMSRVFQNQDKKPHEKTSTDYRFGGNFWLVTETNGSYGIVNVRAGLTDLDRVEIIRGLNENDKVLILPSTHLVETQEQLQKFISARVGGVPGINSQ